MLTLPPLSFGATASCAEEPQQSSRLKAPAARGSVRQYRRSVVLIHRPEEHVGEMPLDGGQRSANVETRVIEERLTHQQIANHLARSREMVTRLMKGLETGGYVEIRQRRLVLLKGPAQW